MMSFLTLVLIDHLITAMPQIKGFSSKLALNNLQLTKVDIGQTKTVTAVL